VTIPQWSPNGCKLAFTRRASTYAESSEIFVMNANGSQQTNISRHPGVDDLAPTWAPIVKRTEPKSLFQ